MNNGTSNVRPVFCDGGENEITFLNGPKLLDEDMSNISRVAVMLYPGT